MPRQIRWRKLLPFLLFQTLTIVAVVIVLMGYVRQQDEARRHTHLIDTAQGIASTMYSHVRAQTPVEDLNILINDLAYKLDLTITILDRGGQILSSSLPPEQLPEDPFSLPAIPRAIVEGQAIQKNDSFLAAATLIQDLNQETVGYVQVQAPHTHNHINLGQVYRLTVVMIVISVMGLILLFLIIQDRLRRPVEKLTIATQEMSTGNFHDLDFPQSPHDLGDLNRSLQQMAENVANQIEALTSERAKLSAVLDQMTDGVLIADAEGRVQLLNPTAERLFRVEEKTGLGRSVVEVLRYHQLVDLWRLAREGERQSTMLEIGPQHIFLQVVAIPLKTSLPGSTLLLFQDLTQLRRLETVRRDFISNVSHELRSPLASLKALAETLQEGALEDPPAARRFILRMETEIVNLTQLVNELLELSRIESGKVPLSFHRTKPCQLVMPAYERMSLQAERAGIELNLDCPTDLPPVFADPDRISQVMINLIHNAIKFTPAGGRINVSAYLDGDHIVFFVRDSGVGIEKKDLGRIFERFYKADRARSGGGTGLGLSIARHMIESHGGYIWVESEENIGSTFYFTLPIA